MSVEDWKSIFDWAAVILVFFTFAAGAGVLITGNILNKRQAVQLRQFEKDLRDEDVKIAEANERTEKLRLEIVSLETPRRLSAAQQKEVASTIAGLPGIHANFSQTEGDSEVTDFAADLYSAKFGYRGKVVVIQDAKTRRADREIRCIDRVRRW